MPSIASQLETLATIKNDIKAAIIEKGQTVGDDFSTYATAIGNIEGGGGSGGSTELITYEKEITTSQYGWWYVEDKDGSLLNAEDYILLGVEFVRRSSDGENNDAYLGCAYQIDSVLTPADYPTYAMTFYRINEGNVFVRSSMTKKVSVTYIARDSSEGSHKQDLSTFSIKNESSMSIIASKNEIEFVYGSGNLIGAQTYKQVDLTNIKSINVTMTSGSHTYDNYQTERFAPILFIENSIDPSSSYVVNNSELIRYIRIDEDNKTVTKRIDVSQLIGSYWIVFSSAGCDCTVTELSFDMNSVTPSPDYSLTEVATGEKWIDGKAVYRRVFNMNHMAAPPSNQWANLNIDTSGMNTLIDAVFLGDDAQGRFDNTVFSGWGATNNNETNTLWILPTVMTGVLDYVILTYTKKRESISVVPIMTSDTTPSGIASASHEHGGVHLAYKVFRQALPADEGWMSYGNGIAGEWVQYQFSEAQIIKQIMVQHFNSNTGRPVKTFKFQGSNDGTTFTDLATCTMDSSASKYSKYFTIDNNNAYLYYRLYVVEGYDTEGVGIGRVDMFTVVE